MAIKFKEIDDKLRKSPLSDEEISIIDKVESYIDDKIINEYTGGPLYIDLTVANFEQTISRDSYRNIAEPRRKLMYEELKRRYEYAGWVCLEQKEYSDSYTQDYFILKGLDI